MVGSKSLFFSLTGMHDSLVNVATHFLNLTRHISSAQKREREKKSLLKSADPASAPV